MLTSNKRNRKSTFVKCQKLESLFGGSKFVRMTNCGGKVTSACSPLISEICRNAFRSNQAASKGANLNWKKTE